ncbi:hypothetical protein [Streptococcus pneumoniae]|nr:hypothetical protein [Streptococcus pneumoniae]
MRWYETDEVSSKHRFEVVDRTDEVSNHTHGIELDEVSNIYTARRR